MECPNSSASVASSHPMARLKARATILSHVTFEKAHAIDDFNYCEVLGEMLITSVVEKFYQRVDADTNESFRLMFSNTDFDQRVQNLTDFLCQRLGGPSYYSDQRGHPSLIRRHCHFEMSSSTAERWLDHFEGALEDTPEVPDPIKEKLMDFLRFTAYFLVAAQEAQSLNAEMSDYDAVREDLTRTAKEVL